MDYTRAPDDQLLRTLAEGDLQALGGLYERHSRAVYHLLLVETGQEASAQDLLQETFLALVDRGRQAAGIRSARAYLLRVAHNLARRAGRQRKDRPLAEVGERATEGPEGRLEGMQARRWLAGLPREQAAVVVLKLWHELTFAEIGKALGIPANTAASRYRYGLEKLRAVAGGEEDGQTTA